VGFIEKNLPILDPENLCMEILDVLETVRVSNGIHEQETVPLPHVLLPHSTELLLPGCI
jgi:hypothetical protein